MHLYIVANNWKIKFRKITSKPIKHFEINLTQDLQDTYNEIYKTLLKAKNDQKRAGGAGSGRNHIHRMELNIL